MASSHVYLLENLILESWRLVVAQLERASEMSEQILSSVKMIKYDRQGRERERERGLKTNNPL